MNVFEWGGIWMIVLSALLSYNHYPWWMSYGSALASVILCMLLPYYFNKYNSHHTVGEGGNQH